jgi:hypothetical protein
VTQSPSYPNIAGVGAKALTVTTGVPVLPDANGNVSLTATTFYFEVSNADATQNSVQVSCDGVIAATFTIELSNRPVGKADAEDTTAFVVDLSAWQLWNPSTAVVPASAGSTPTNATVAVVAGAATGFTWLLPDMAVRRMRVKAVVTTPGKCRVLPFGKY